MSKRITVIFDDEIHKKLRVIQAKKISQSQSFVSFSSIVVDALKKPSRNWKL